MAIFGEPTVDWDVDVSLFPWKWQVPDVITNEWFPAAVVGKLQACTWQEPIKFSFAGPGRVSFLMRLGVATGAQDGADEDETLVQRV